MLPGDVKGAVSIMYQSLGHGFHWSDILDLNDDWKQYIDAIKAGKTPLPNTTVKLSTNCKSIFAKWTDEQLLSLYSVPWVINRRQAQQLFVRTGVYSLCTL